MKHFLVFFIVIFGFSFAQADPLDVIKDIKDKTLDVGKSIVETANDKLIQKPVEVVAKVTERVPVLGGLAAKIIRTAADLENFALGGSIETVGFLNEKTNEFSRAGGQLVYSGLKAVAKGTATIAVYGFKKSGDALTVTYHIAYHATEAAKDVAGKTLVVAIVVSKTAVEASYVVAETGGQAAVAIGRGAVVTIAEVVTVVDQVEVTAGFDLTLVSADAQVAVTIGHISVDVEAGVAIN